MIVIPMAGMSRRFKEAGYNQAKYRLSLDGRSLFAHAVDSFRSYFSVEPFLFIARNELDIESFIKQEIKLLGISTAHIVVLSRPTLGQADTVRLGLFETAVDQNEPLTIFNIDTFRPNFRYPDFTCEEHVDGYLEVMDGTDPGFSYVLPNGEDSNLVAVTAEKKVISNLASTGLYWFRQSRDFIESLIDEERNYNSENELYIAPLYNSLIAKGLDIRYHKIQPEEVIFCGTPLQYEVLLKK